MRMTTRSDLQPAPRGHQQGLKPGGRGKNREKKKHTHIEGQEQNGSTNLDLGETLKTPFADVAGGENTTEEVRRGKFPWDDRWPTRPVAAEPKC